MNDGSRRVVITGLGIICPLGNDVPTVWSRLLAGQSGIGVITKFDASRLTSRIAGEVRDFNPEDFMERRAARRMDLFAQYAVAAARQAAQHAGLDVDAEPELIGATVASGVGGLGTFEQQARVLLTEGPRRLSPFLAPMMLPNMAAAQVSLELGLKGPLSAVCTACSAGANAIGDAFEIIRRGAAEAMLAGGTDAGINEIGVGAFDVMRALSPRNEAPEQASRPFDAGRDGFVIAEGAGILVLEELEHARARGARIEAEIVGYGMSSEAFHMTRPDDTGEPQARAMAAALREAGMSTDEVDYVNAHATSTPAGDIGETRALKLAFGPRMAEVPVSSTKSMTGHMLGAAGAVEALFCVRVITEGAMPPTINLTDPDPACDLDYVPNVARTAPVRAAMSNSFGFGGHDVSLVFRRYAG
jgi:3-oxoacyl-[acyl-carrier-protein] synthase II